MEPGKLWSFPEGASRPPPPRPAYQAHGGKLLLRTHLMEGSLSALTLEHREEPACWSRPLPPVTTWTSRQRGLRAALPAAALEQL